MTARASADSSVRRPYMAPEQLAGDRATERTDLYALGLVFYELFAGRMLFSSPYV